MPDVLTVDCWGCQAGIHWETKVAGSRGNSYTVVFDSKRGYNCSCPGNTFHGKCKHTALADRIRAEWDWSLLAGIKSSNGCCADCGRNLR